MKLYNLIKIKSGILIIFLIILVITSCQKIITIDLNSVNSVLVVEGSITDEHKVNYVILRKTTNYFDSNIPFYLKGATVVISDNFGQIDTLTDNQNGYYAIDTTRIKGIPGHTYNLYILAEGKEYRASSTMPQPVSIDSLTLQLNTNGGFGGGPGSGGPGGMHDNSKSYNLTCHFKDPVGEGNYYRINIYRNDTIQKNRYNLATDKYSDGVVIHYALGRQKSSVSDINIKVNLLGIDKPNYDFFLTFPDVFGGSNDMQAAPPSNPLSNISNKALGYFGAWSVRSKSIVITP